MRASGMLLALFLAGCPAAPRASVAPAPSVAAMRAGTLRVRLPANATFSSLCVGDAAELVLEGDSVLRLTVDEPTVIEGGGIVPARSGLTLTLESSGTSTIWLFIDMRHASSLVIRGDIGARALRIRATGPRDAYSIHLRDLRTGGIGTGMDPGGNLHVERGLVFLRGASTCGMCPLEPEPPACASR